MIRAFLADESSGPRARVNAKHGWLLAIMIVANELRGIVVAYEGARMLGWL